jgi:CRP/FNR family transcriptional regulator
MVKSAKEPGTEEIASRREPGMAEGVGNERFDALRACRAWSPASDQAIGRLAEKASLERFAKGELLISEGTPATRFGVVASGRARVFHLAADGHRLTYEDLGPGQPFGMVAVVAGGRNPAHVEGLEDGSAVWVLRDELLGMLEREPQAMRGLLQNLAERVVDFTAMVNTLSLDVPARVASYLFQRSLAAGSPGADGLSVELGMRKTELAEALGTVPESVSRALARLRDDGIIEVQGSTVVVLDVGALARLSSGYSEG